ncbi:MAG: hypothetical protein N4A65_01080 [Cohaesibacter sp.]|jgi:hypothetical protein|nr:hypothetical protein [Cohaesibacter sp.]
MTDPRLTEDMNLIADILGMPIVEELMQKLPGIEIKVPTLWTKENPLSRLSRETADLIISNFPGDKFYVPTRLQPFDKKIEARRLADEGKSPLDIALTLRISERYVRMLLAGKVLPRRFDERQLDIEDIIDLVR